MYDVCQKRVPPLTSPGMPSETDSDFVDLLKRDGAVARVKMAGCPPKIVKSGICQQVVYEGEGADLGILPIIQCWPLDGDLRSGQVFDSVSAQKAADSQTGTGKYITLGGVHTRNPIDGSRNI